MVLKSNPVTDYLATKEAALGGFRKFLGAAGQAVGQAAQRSVEGGGASPLAMGLMAGVGMALPPAVVVAGEHLYDAATRGRDFKKMMKNNPHLRQYQEEEPAAFKSMYDSLRRMNPDFAADPMVSGAYMHKAMETAPEERAMVAVDAFQQRRPVPPSMARQLGAEAGKALSRGVSTPAPTQEPRFYPTEKTVYEQNEEGKWTPKRQESTIYEPISVSQTE